MLRDSRSNFPSHLAPLHHACSLHLLLFQYFQALCLPIPSISLPQYWNKTPQSLLYSARHRTACHPRDKLQIGILCLVLSWSIELLRSSRNVVLHVSVWRKRDCHTILQIRRYLSQASKEHGSEIAVSRMERGCRYEQYPTWPETVCSVQLSSGNDRIRQTHSRHKRTHPWRKQMHGRTVFLTKGVGSSMCYSWSQIVSIPWANHYWILQLQIQSVISKQQEGNKIEQLPSMLFIESSSHL